MLRKRLEARKVDYRRRVRLLSGCLNRVVVRLTHNHFLMQYVETMEDERNIPLCDFVRFTCSTYGRGTGNNETTLRLIAEEFKQKLPHKPWIFDFGLYSPQNRSRYRAVIEVLEK